MNWDRLQAWVLIPPLLSIMVLAVGTITTENTDGGGHYKHFLPFVAKPVILAKLGNVESPVDIEDTSFGILVASAEGQVKNITTNQTLLDVQDYFAGRQNSGVFAITYEVDRLFVKYTLNTEIERQQYVVSYQRKGDLFDRSTETELLYFKSGVDSPHGGGDLVFGPDGYLYVTAGDGASRQGDPNRRAQDLSLLDGSLMRLDPLGNAPVPSDCSLVSGNYTIPRDNPFVDGIGGNCDEIVSYGFRHPWRFSFDAETGDLWIIDVGWHGWEEINYAPARDWFGSNYGWPCYEGHEPVNVTGCSEPYTFPEHVYPLTEGRCAIVGVYLYRGELLSYYGQVIYADHCDGKVMALNMENDSVREIVHLEGALWSTVNATDEGEILLADFASGDIYMLR